MIEQLYKHEFGRCQVEAMYSLMKDIRRNRNIPIKIYYPAEQGSYPVIIFSHGAGGSREGFSYLGQFWASHGYVAIHITHLGSDTSALKEQGSQAIKKIASDPEHWRDRAQDISFIIDSFSKIERRNPSLENKINPSLIGVAGHSFGAYTTMLIAGAVVETPWSQATSFQDVRVSASLAISPPGTGQHGLNRNSWSQLTNPMMVISGSKDSGLDGQPASWRLEAFAYMPPVDKYHVLIVGAYHFSYSKSLVQRNSYIAAESDRKLSIGHPEPLPLQGRIHKYVQSMSATFWDTYLKQDQTGKELLTSDLLQSYSQGEMSILVR